MSASDTLETLALNKILRNEDFTITQPYISLHSANPGETGTAELAGGTYARQSAAFASAASPGGTSQNSGAITFTQLPAATITHFGVWSAASSGTFLLAGSLNASKVVSLGDSFQFAASGITVTFD